MQQINSYPESENNCFSVCRGGGFVFDKQTANQKFAFYQAASEPYWQTECLAALSHSLAGGSVNWQRRF